MSELAHRFTWAFLFVCLFVCVCVCVCVRACVCFVFGMSSSRDVGLQWNRDALAEYEAAHIPTATFFDVDAIKDETSLLPHMLPSASTFQNGVLRAIRGV